MNTLYRRSTKNSSLPLIYFTLAHRYERVGHSVLSTAPLDGPHEKLFADRADLASVQSDASGFGSTVRFKRKQYGYDYTICAGEDVAVLETPQQIQDRLNGAAA